MDNDYKKKLKRWYDSIAEKYETWGKRNGEYFLASRSKEVINFNRFLDKIKIKGDSKILDVATGTGIYLIEALKRGGYGYGIDISKKMLMELKKKALKLKEKIVELKQVDAETLPYPSIFFDMVICMGLFDYYPLDEVEVFLKEIKRVLKDDGKVILDFPNKNNTKVYEFQEKERSVGHEVYLYDKQKIIDFLDQQSFMFLGYGEAGIEIQFLLKKKI